MSTVTITQNQTQYTATAGDYCSSGRTMGEALDALLQQKHITAPIVIQQFGGDAFFTQEQYDRLQALRKCLGSLNDEEQSELESLIDAQLQASQDRLKATRR